MKKQYYLLHIEDDLDDIVFFKKVFKEINLPIEFYFLSSESELLQYIEKLEEGFYSRTPDVILLDWKMPGSSGELLLKYIKASNVLKYTPVVVLSSSDRPQDIDVAYTMGASGFIRKPEDLQNLRKIAETFCSYWFEISSFPSTQPQGN